MRRLRSHLRRIPKTGVSMAPKSTRPGKTEFLIDEFFAEIEKAEDIAASKPLYAERMKNKRALDRAEAAEKEAATPKTPLEKRRTTKANYDTATGMAPRAPRSKANAVERVSFDGMGEPAQAGFNHRPSAKALSARDISREAAKDPEVLGKLREAVDTAKRKAKTPGAASLADAQTV